MLKVSLNEFERAEPYFIFFLAGSDFMAISLDVVIQPLTSQTCTEFTVINDNLAEAQTETFMVTFSTSSDLKVGSNSIANVSIIDSYGKSSNEKNSNSIIIATIVIST